MKTLNYTILLCFALSFSTISTAQVVINEIMYNSQSGSDPYEFIELYNAGSSAVDLTNYDFAQGVNFTFPSFTLGAGEYVVIAGNDAELSAAFDLGGATVFASTGGLGNSGETIELVDGSANQVDIVNYDDSVIWPIEADGFGRSLELCDAAGDNDDPTTWNASQNGTGVNTPVGQEIFASPGTANNCTAQGTPAYNQVSVDQINDEDADGVATALFDRVEIVGVVHGNNLRPNGGSQFTVIDVNGDGMHVFSDDVDFGYTVTEGDMVTVQGPISQFNGFTQVVPDAIMMMSAGNALVEPSFVDDLGEDTESQLIRLSGFSIVDPGQWSNSGSGFNVQITDGSVTVEMRIDADVDIFGTNPPTGTFDLIGLGSQFDNQAPFNDGYQVLPRYLEDIITPPSATIDPAIGAAIKYFPNPVQEVLLVETTTELDAIVVTNILGQEVKTITTVNALNEIDVTTLEQGTYALTFIQEGRIWTVNFVKL